MQIDFVSLCLIGIIIIAVLVLASRMMKGGGAQEVDYSQRGSGRPEHDDPNISSRGGFGGDSSREQPPGSERPHFDNPDIDSRGGFGRDRPNETPDRSEPDTSSRSSFGDHVRSASAPDDRKPPLKGGGSSHRSNDDDDKPHTRSESNPTHDDPDVESRGGFGRDKD